jgi:hypothetical protein
MPLLEQRDELLEEAADLIGMLAVDGDLVAAGTCTAASGKAVSTRRSSSSCVPSRPTIRWLPGTWIFTWVAAMDLPRVEANGSREVL